MKPLLPFGVGRASFSTGLTDKPSEFGVERATSTGLTDKPNHVTSDAPPASPGLHGFADFAGYPLSSLEDAVLGVVHDVLQPVVNWRY